MKATGIVRRIDDLGRVVIPKEVRRALRLREGDPLELYIVDNGVVFKKYRISYEDDIRAIVSMLKDDVHYAEDSDEFNNQKTIIKALSAIADAMHVLENK